MADSPKQAEAAQALFSAIVDYRGAPIKEIYQTTLYFLKHIKGKYGQYLER